MKVVRIYTLSDARDPDNIRYVGKTVQTLKKRLSGHIHDAKTAKMSNYCYNHNWNWIAKVLSEGSNVIIEEVDSLEINDFEDWKWLEKYWISQFKTWGFKLTNLTDGGDGNQGQKFSAESIAKRAAALRGRPRDEETRKRISESHKGRAKSEEHKAHVKESMVAKLDIPIVQLDRNTRELIREYPSITEAAMALGKSKANIAKCCKHLEHYNTAYGYIWMYKDEYLV